MVENGRSPFWRLLSKADAAYDVWKNAPSSAANSSGASSAIWWPQSILRPLTLDAQLRQMLGISPCRTSKSSRADQSTSRGHVSLQQQKRLSFATEPDPKCCFRKFDLLQFESIEHICSCSQHLGTFRRETSFNDCYRYLRLGFPTSKKRSFADIALNMLQGSP